MATYDHSCLVTTLQNTSGKELFFGFLPPHGVRLIAGEEINVFGDIKEAVNRGDRFGSRSMQALLDALDRGDITILSTPLPIAWDDTDGDAQVMGVANSVLVLSDPCWETAL